MIDFVLTDIAKAHMERNGYTHFDLVGYCPQCWDESDPRPAREQAHSNYAHGGGWQKFDGFELRNYPHNPELHYPGDPKTVAIAQAKLREERIILFQRAWVAIVQPDGSFEVARMD